MSRPNPPPYPGGDPAAVPPHASDPAVHPAYRHPHPVPTTYSLMLRTWTYRAWKPWVGLWLVLVAMLVVVPILLVPVLALTLLIDDDRPLLEAISQTLQLDPLTWQGLLWLNLTLAALIPLTWGVVRWLHRLRPRWLASVGPGIRWRFFWACFGVSLVAIAAQIVVGMFLPGEVDSLAGTLNTFTAESAKLTLVVLVTTPLQAIGEEYIFRGYVMQAFGSLTRSPWFAILLSGLLFALAHGAQNIPLFTDRFAFGLIAGYLVHRTGGLEAGIALHVWNNLFAFGFGILFGDLTESLNVSTVSWWHILLTLTQNGVYLVLVLWVARRMGVADRTTPPVVRSASHGDGPALAPPSEGV